MLLLCLVLGFGHVSRSTNDLIFSIFSWVFDPVDASSQYIHTTLTHDLSSGTCMPIICNCTGTRCISNIEKSIKQAVQNICI